MRGGFVAVGGLVVVLGLAIGWGRLEYGPHPPLPHRRITITLPYTAANEVQHLIPMGETIEHAFPGGHPGIDFQWDHAVPLIAVADGTITSIRREKDLGEPVWYLTLQSGAYLASYKELEDYAPGLKVGTAVRQGDLIGTPHCHTGPDGHDGCQLHWEFAYASFLPAIAGLPDRLCPLMYFDPAARARIEAAWATVDVTRDKFKAQFPDICSNIYRDHDQ